MLTPAPGRMHHAYHHPLPNQTTIAASVAAKQPHFTVDMASRRERTIPSYRPITIR